jgi:hypothetical protein
MKLPRWLVVSLLSISVLALVGAGAWWWVTWPERTAEKFIAWMGRERDLEELLRMNWIDSRAQETLLIAAYEEPPSVWTQSNLERRPRSLNDMLLGCREFEVRNAARIFTDFGGGVHLADNDLVFAIRRGKLVYARWIGPWDKYWDEQETP